MEYESDYDDKEKKYNLDDMLDNDNVCEILENNFESNFTLKLRQDIEDLKQKYINLYLGGGIFKHDEYNANWERLFKIIYNNVEKKYDLGMIEDDPEFFINILENKCLK